MAECHICSICGEALWVKSYPTESLADTYVEVRPCDGPRHDEAKAQMEAFAKQFVLHCGHPSDGDDGARICNACAEQVGGA
jgi:hypothetical protein